jgi:hypothetical protein
VTKIYGVSDDLIEFEGDVNGEVNYIGKDPSETCLIVCSDGTILECHYGNFSIWRFELVTKGSLLIDIESCSRDGDAYSDIVSFKDGLTRIYVAHKWEEVK